VEVPRQKDLKAAQLENKLSVVVVGICAPSIEASKDLIQMMADLSDLKCPVALDGPAKNGDQYEWVSEKYKALKSGVSWFLISPDGKIIASGADSPSNALKSLKSETDEKKENETAKSEKAPE